MVNSLQGIRQFRDSLSPENYHPQARLGTDYVPSKVHAVSRITAPARHIFWPRDPGCREPVIPGSLGIALELEIPGKFPP
jgi:hypothetical protein